MGFFNRLGKKLDERKWGIIFGTVLPIIAFLILWQWRLGDYSLKQALGIISGSANNRNVLTFPILPNLFLFYFTNFRWRWYRFSTGLVIVTILFALLIASIIIL